MTGEGDRISSIAAVLEEEDRLSETQVSVLVDRRTPAERRNLRWDVLSVAVPGGLLHAKVAALLWERCARIIVGSANLTSARVPASDRSGAGDRPRRGVPHPSAGAQRAGGGASGSGRAGAGRCHRATCPSPRDRGRAGGTGGGPRPRCATGATSSSRWPRRGPGSRPWRGLMTSGVVPSPYERPWCRPTGTMTRPRPP